MSRKIIIESVESPSSMRFPYCNDPESLGDWYVDDDGNTRVVIVGTDPLDDDQAFLVAIHEIVEMKLCRKEGVPQESVDEFDAQFKGPGEPGEDPRAPYFDQHRKALIVEYLLATWLNMEHYDSR